VFALATLWKLLSPDSLDSTFFRATVEGFGWLLVFMGIAQTAAGQRTTRLFYLATFALILVYREVPWAHLMLERLRH
jgi:hypothetical protein